MRLEENTRCCDKLKLVLPVGGEILHTAAKPHLARLTILGVRVQYLHELRAGIAAAVLKLNVLLTELKSEKACARTYVKSLAP